MSRTQPTEPLSTPRHVGRFQIRGHLGAGAFSVVYRAHDPQLDREVALKVAQAPGDRPELRERFLREARAVARLRHPHIVPIYDTGSEGEASYLATRLIEGSTLEETIKKEPLSPIKGARLVRDLAEALAYAHRLGIIHRDVKPANVMLDQKGRAFLMDFGLAHLRDEAQKLTHDGAILGTPAYLAPEHAMGHSGPPQPASDQYSLGVILYELLTGQLPFSGSPAAVLRKVVSEQPPSPRSLRRSVPRDLETICLKAMARQPQDRYRDCQELADDLRRWLEGEPIRARRLSPLERVIRWYRRDPRSAMGITAALGGFFFAVLTPMVLAVLLSRAVHQEERARQEAEEEEQHAREEGQQAETRAEEARQATQNAERARSQMATRRKEAEEARRKAEKQTSEALRAVRILEHRKAAQKSYAYVGDFLQAGRHPASLDALIPTNPQDEDLRGFEWFYLRARLIDFPTTPTFSGPVLHFTMSSAKSLALLRKGSPQPNGLITVTQAIHDLPTSKDRVIRTILVAPEDLARLQLSSDGLVLLQNRANASPLLWTGNAERPVVIKHDRDSMTYSTLSANGKILTVWAPKSGIKVYDGLTGKEIGPIPVPSLLRSTLSPDGKWLVTCASVDNSDTKNRQIKCQLWSLPDRKEQGSVLLNHSLPIFLAFAPDSSLAAVLTDQLHLVELPSLRVKSTPAESGTGRLEFLSKDCLLTPANKLYRIAQGRFWPDPVQPTVTSSPDGKRLAWFDQVSEAPVLVDLETGMRFSFPALALGQQPAKGKFLRFTPDNKQLAVLDSNGAITFYPVTGFQDRWSTGDKAIRSLCLLDRGKRIVFLEEQHLVEWDETRQQRVPWEAAGTDVVALSGASNAARLATLHASGTFRVWQTDPEKLVREFQVTGDWSTLTLSPDGGLLAAITKAGQVHLWETASGKLLRDWKAAPGLLAFSPDGRWLLSAGDSAILWEVTRAGEKVVLSDSPTSITTLAFSPDGRDLAVVGKNSELVFWQLDKPDTPLSLADAPSDVTALAFSADGRTLATGGARGVIRLWNKATGQEMVTLNGHGKPIQALAFTPSGTMLLSADAEGQLRFWTAPRRK